MAEILLIDDMDAVRRAIGAVLKRAGHRVITAVDGAEGLALLKRQRFDVAIIDMLMPKVSGTDVIAEMDKMPNRPVVLAISGGGDGVSATEALRTARFKADAVLEKPFDKELFLCTIEKLLTPSP
jgi:CheY-like chemotaxis protein